MSESITLTLQITPVPKPRQTRRDKWLKPPRPEVARYRNFADRLQLLLLRARVTLPREGLSLRFDMPMPPSWSKRRRTEMCGKPHMQKPDLDNMTKAVLDAALPDSDCEVWHIAGLEKRWATDGAVVLTITPMEK